MKTDWFYVITTSRTAPGGQIATASGTVVVRSNATRAEIFKYIYDTQVPSHARGTVMFYTVEPNAVTA